MPKHILILNPSAKRMRKLEVAKEMGLKITYADDKFDPLFKGMSDHFIEINTLDPAATLEILLAAHKQDPFDGIITFLDRGVEIQAAFAKKTGLIGNSPVTAKATRHKYFMRTLLEKAGVACPRFLQVRSYEDLEAAATKVGFPFIFKPVGAASSKAIFLIEDHTNLLDIYQQMLAATKGENDIMFRFYPQEYIAEEFMVGDEYSVEGVASFGQINFAGITEKWTIPDNFTEIQHAFPARISENVEAQILSVTQRALQAIGWEHGGFHLEVMLTNTGPKVVEINGRLGGDYITTHLVQAGRGIDIIRASYNAALGLPVEIQKKWEQGACVSYLIAEKEGILQNISGIEESSQCDDVLEVILERKIGDRISFPPKNYGEFRLAAVITKGKSPSEAISNAKSALGKLNTEINE